MVDSRYGAQQSIMIHFSFTSGFSWCTTASLVRSSKTFFSGGQCTICSLHQLPHHTDNFGSVFTDTCVLAFSHMFAFFYVWICFIPMLHVFVIILSQRVPTGSEERYTNTFLVPWLAHNLLFAWPASPHRHFCFRFYRQLHFCKFIYVWVWKLLNKVHSYVSFICNVSIPVCSHRLIRATMDRHPKRSIPSSWWARAVQIVICLLAHIHVCLIQFRLHPQVNSTEMKTYFHTPTMALRLHS